MSSEAGKHRIVPKMLRGRVRQPPTCANCGAQIAREGWGDWQHEATKARGDEWSCVPDVPGAAS